MGGCCENKCDALAALRQKQRSVLLVVLGVNATMFLVEVVVGLVTHSNSVLADSLDMFGDAVVYASSLYVLGRGRLWQARMAALKGAIMVAFGLAVLGDAVAKVLGARLPAAEGMGVVGVLALAANLYCLYVLTRHRDDDLNMKSVWLCSRNDIAANVGLLLAAAGVAISRSRWPDIVVGLGVAGLFLSSSLSVLRAAIGELRHARATS